MLGLIKRPIQDRWAATVVLDDQPRSQHVATAEAHPLTAAPSGEVQFSLTILSLTGFGCPRESPHERPGAASKRLKSWSKVSSESPMTMSLFFTALPWGSQRFVCGDLWRFSRLNMLFGFSCYLLQVAPGDIILIVFLPVTALKAASCAQLPA